MRLNQLFLKYNKFFIIILDLFIISFSFLVLAIVKPATIRVVLPNYTDSFLVYAGLWVLISYLIGKYNLNKFKKPIQLWIAITISAFIILSIVSTILFSLKLGSYSRMLVMGTVFLCYFLELIVFRVIYGWMMVKNKNDQGLFNILNKEKPEPSEVQKIFLHQKIAPIENEAVFEFIDSQVNLKASERIMLLTEQKVEFKEENIENLRAVINLKPLNKFKNVNNYLLTMRTLIPDAGLIVGCIETYGERKARFKKIFKAFWKIAYLSDFFLNRVIPRLLFLDKIYTYLTNDSYHLMSRAEILGRLVYCGYSIIDFKAIDGLTYFVGMNTHEPSTRSVTKYPFIKLWRVGKHGKIIGVYKFRTMHPYSEYLQKFIVELNGYNEVGKPANDFRLTGWGKFLRKFWLDEFPQLINVLKGEMKLVGVRPLSETRFNELPKEVQEARVKHKPGCFPPYVALNMPSSEDNIEAEVIYMKDKEENPKTTDFKYLWKSVYNILTNKIRSS